MNKQVADAKVFGIQGFCKVSFFNIILKEDDNIHK